MNRLSRTRVKRIAALVVLSVLVLPAFQPFHVLDGRAPPGTHRSSSGDDVSAREITRTEQTRSPTSYPHQKRVVFDESRLAYFSVWDTSFYGYSDFALLLRGMGYQVDATTRGVLDVIPSLEKGDVLFLGVTMVDLTEAEIDAIVDFVHRGGGIMVIGEHYRVGLPDFPNKVNPLSERFGITLNGDEIKDPKYNVGGNSVWPLVRSSYFDLKNIPLYACASLNLTGNAVSLASTSPHSTPPSSAVAAVSTYGEGNVIVITDSEIFWSGGGDLGLSYKDAAEFTRKCFDLLSNVSEVPPVTITPDMTLFTADKFQVNVTVNATADVFTEISGGSVTPRSVSGASGTVSFEIEVEEDGYVRFHSGSAESVVRFLKPSGSDFSVYFYQGSGSRPVDESLCGLLDFAGALRDRRISSFAGRGIPGEGQYHCCVVVNPLSTEGAFNLSVFEKVILLGEPYSWLLDEVGIYMEGTYLVRPHPMNSFSAQMGLEFAHRFIYDPESGGDPLVIPAAHTYGFSFELPRASYMVNNTDIHGAAHADERCFDASINPFSRAPRDDNVPNVYGPAVIAYNENVFASGDADVFTNQYSGEDYAPDLYDSVVDWLYLSMDVTRRDGLFWEYEDFTVTASPWTQRVEVITVDGTELDLRYDPELGTWVGSYRIPTKTAEGNYRGLLKVYRDEEKDIELGLVYHVEGTGTGLLYPSVLAVLAAVPVSFLIIKIIKRKKRLRTREFRRIKKNKGEK